MCPAFLLEATHVSNAGTTPFGVRLQDDFLYHTIPIVLLSNCYKQMN